MLGSRRSRPRKEGPVNNLPKCLALDLNVEPGRRRRGAQALTLNMTMHFHEDSIPFRFGRVRVGLTGGDLLLGLEGVEFVKHHEYAPFPKKVTVKSTQTESQTKGNTIEDASKPGLTAELGMTGPKITSSLSGERKKSRSGGATSQAAEEITQEHYQISALGGPAPGWRFRKRERADFLQGSFVNEKFADCKLSGAGGRVEARFEVEQEFIRMKVISGIFKAKGVYPPQNPQKLKIANFLIWKLVVAPRLRPWLSWVAVTL
jgi:hypothetical protein